MLSSKWQCEMADIEHQAIANSNCTTITILMFTIYQRLASKRLYVLVHIYACFMYHLTQPSITSHDHSPTTHTTGNATLEEQPTMTLPKQNG